MPTLRQQYRSHIRSQRWRSLRTDILRSRGTRCEKCGATGRLCLHHKTYDRFGRELPSDLELLCCRCHHNADRERAAGRRRFSRTVQNCPGQLSLFPDDYDAHDDVAKSFDEAYRVIRERMAKGGPGWTPKAR